MSAPVTVTGLAVNCKAIAQNITGTPPALISGVATLAALSITWGASEPTATYRVQYKRNADSIWLDGGVTPLGAASAKLFGLNVTDSYDVRVHGERSGDPNGTDATITAQATGTPTVVTGTDLTPPTVAVTVLGPTSARCTFTDSLANKARWFCVLSVGGVALFGTWPAPLDRTLDLTGLDPATTYLISVITHGYAASGDRYSGSTTTQVAFTTDPALASPFTGNIALAANVFGFKDAGLSTDAVFSPDPGYYVNWTISGAPAGTTITGLGTNTLVGRIQSTPGTSGIFDAFVTAQWVTGVGSGVTHTLTAPVRFLIDGGKIVSWLAADPSRVDLQIDQRTRDLFSSKDVNVDEGLPLSANDDLNVWVIFRDGGKVITPPVEALRLKLMLLNRFDAAPLLDLRPAPLTVEFIPGGRAYRFIAPISHPLLTAIFAELNSKSLPTSNAPASIALALQASWSIGGVWTTSRTLKTTLFQDFTKK